MKKVSRQGGSIAKDLTGQRFGAWVVISRAENRGIRVGWLCRCDCGTEKRVESGNLKGGGSLSCGCQKGANISAALAPSGTRVVDDPAYDSWRSMWARCTSERDISFPNYGGRGITVCAAWVEFATFLSDMGPRPSRDHTIDRVKGAGNYEPGNCRWATYSEQNRNRRGNRYITLGDRTMTLIEWSEETGIPSGTLGKRLKCGWPADRVLSKEFRPKAKCA